MGDDPYRWLTLRFSVRGLGSLADHLFVTFAGRLGSVNSAGVKKIQRNVQALQQTLRSAAATDQEGLLTKSLAYWDLYESGPKVSGRCGTADFRPCWMVFALANLCTLLKITTRCSTCSASLLQITRRQLSSTRI